MLCDSIPMQEMKELINFPIVVPIVVPVVPIVVPDHSILYSIIVNWNCIVVSSSGFSGQWVVSAATCVDNTMSIQWLQHSIIDNVYTCTRLDNGKQEQEMIECITMSLRFFHSKSLNSNVVTKLGPCHHFWCFGSMRIVRGSWWFASMFDNLTVCFSTIPNFVVMLKVLYCRFYKLNFPRMSLISVIRFMLKFMGYFQGANIWFFIWRHFRSCNVFLSAYHKFDLKCRSAGSIEHQAFSSG